MTILRATALCLIAPALVALSAITVFAGFSMFGHHERVKAENGEIRLPLDSIAAEEARYFQFKQDGKTVKFFVVRSPDKVIRAAFDACDVCYPSKKGYSRSGDFMICNNCGRRFHTSRINIEEGGCNPAPLKRTVAGAHLVIKVADILPGSRFF